MLAITQRVEKCCHQRCGAFSWGCTQYGIEVFLNNPEALSEKYKEQIVAVVHKLNYVPSATARSMRTKLKNMVAVVVPDILTPLLYGSV